jgi:hypothetical protein
MYSPIFIIILEKPKEITICVLLSFKDVTPMKISQETRFGVGFRKWSVTHPPASNDDDHPGGATPIALTAPELDDPIMAPPEQAYRPWLVQGVGVGTL